MKGLASEMDCNKPTVLSASEENGFTKIEFLFSTKGVCCAVDLILSGFSDKD